MATLADKNNNPGNLRNPKTGQFRQFATPEEGMAALLNDLQAKINGNTTTGLSANSTIHDFASKYAPAGDNNSVEQYTVNLANTLGIRPDTPLGQLQPHIGEFAQAIAKNEGYTPAKGFKTTLAINNNANPLSALFPNMASASTGQDGQTQSDPLKTAESVANFASMGIGKQTGEAIGTLGGLAFEKLKGLFGGQDNSKYYDTSAPTPLQVAGDVAQGALAVGGMMPAGASAEVLGKTIPVAIPAAKSVFGRIASSALIGAGMGATGSIANGSTDIGEIAKNAGVSALIGGALGTTAEAISAALNSMPKRLAQGALRINPKTLENKPGLIDQALNDISFGTKGTMERESQTLLNDYNQKIAGYLDAPEYQHYILNGQEAAKMVTEKFTDSSLTTAQVGKIVKAVAPEASGLFDKFVTGGLNLQDTNRLRSLIDKSTSSVYTRNAVVPFNKEVATSFADILRGAIQGGAEETAPLFEKYTREIAIHNALAKINQAPTFKITLGDLMKGMVFGDFTGVGTIPALAGNELIQNRTVALNAAKALNKVAKPVSAAAKAAVVPITTGTSR